VQSHHIKTKSAVIPRLDLTKIKRDAEFEAHLEVGTSDESHLTFTEGYDEDLLEEPCFPEKKMFSENIQLKEIDLVNRRSFKVPSDN
jgi:hypothetical protein